MKTTPNFGWPVAQGTDPAKQYPATVDDPFKTALDTLLQPVARDTGWRSISANLVNGWTGSVVIRRCGPVVFLTVLNVTVPGTWNAVLIAGLTGFMGTKGIVGAMSKSDLSVSTVTAYTDATNLLGATGSVKPPAATVLTVSLTWPTSQAWPTTLPGTPSLLKDSVM